MIEHYDFSQVGTKRSKDFGDIGLNKEEKHWQNCRCPTMNGKLFITLHTLGMGGKI